MLVYRLFLNRKYIYYLHFLHYSTGFLMPATLLLE